MAQPEGNTRWEELKVTGDQLVSTLKGDTPAGGDRSGSGAPNDPADDGA